jgi:hypothetical protein
MRSTVAASTFQPMIPNGRRDSVFNAINGYPDLFVLLKRQRLQRA